MPLTSTATGRGADTSRATRPAGQPAAARPAKGGDPDANRRQARSVAKQQQAAERIAAATAEISAQNAEAAEASRQLSEAMQQIAAGAEQASGATQQSLAAMNQIEEQVGGQQQTTRQVADLSQALQNLLNETRNGISNLLANVDSASTRQSASVATITELEKQADEIGEIVKTVAHIADQTNLLALNAAIEAARARQHGKGFAVVADEVRTLAETSERSARQIRDLIDEVRNSVTEIAGAVQTSAETARGEVEKGMTITSQLETIRADMGTIMAGATEMAAAAEQARKAAGSAKQRSEEIAAAAEQQSAACEESLQTVAQQTQALRQSEQAAEALAEVSETLRSSTDIAKSAEEVASAAEELSAAVEEINRAATQINVAINEINTGARTAAEKGQQTAEAVNQIEQGAQLSSTRGGAAVERADVILELLATNKQAVDSMITAIGTAAREGIENVRKVTELEQISRRIDKIVDAIANVSIQTNMLAVNGSVESARAGEFGKGFAVVSTDIRNLARDSADNADRIKDLVKSVQDRIVEVRADLEETSRLSLAEVESAKATTARLEEIERDMQQVRGGNEEVRESAQAIASNLGEVKTGLEQISSAANQAEQLAGQASTAAREQAQGAEELAAAVEEIAALADELQNAA
ncbi:chemotaxis protein [Actinoplanes philippinensis]|uniref:Methyl-accepting chemotaxis protein n=1 Tax=Actinoplanes philippinensis TaxID=35752 RepID=A0A1I2JN68_9ACTN|nr:methyl-accepting chemotaxis protein [Actinoplanes philippinensis]GIE80351.1 chemotaxis protein [Actinoplanes philippinensis]SFF56262.1 methyl-accepting chemotaxis protein [Actinoplanes philippinensis]